MTLYVAKLIQAGADSAKDHPVKEVVLVNHKSMDALVEWAKFHGLRLGRPEVYTPFFSVRHADGSPLNPEEMECIKNEL